MIMNNVQMQCTLYLICGLLHIQQIYTNNYHAKLNKLKEDNFVS